MYTAVMHISVGCGEKEGESHVKKRSYRVRRRGGERPTEEGGRERVEKRARKKERKNNGRTRDREKSV